MTEVIVVYKCESSLLRGVMAPEAFLNEMLRPPPPIWEKPGLRLLAESLICTARRSKLFFYSTTQTIIVIFLCRAS